MVLFAESYAALLFATLCLFISLSVAISLWWWGGGNKLMLLSSQQAVGIKTHIVPF